MNSAASVLKNRTFVAPKYLLNYFLSKGASFAWWRLPQQQNASLLIDFSTVLEKKTPVIEEMGTGFLISPFINPDLKDTIFLNADLLLDTTWKEGKIVIAADELPHDLKSTIQNSENEVFGNNLKLSLHKNVKTDERSTSKEEYIHLVEKAIKGIKSGNLQKVVPSRVKVVSLDNGFDLIENFQNLCLAYPNAMVVCYSVPGLGTWMAATPETLINVDRNGIFKTISLAGTQPFPTDKPISEVSWTQKEIEEQALVSRYIINCLKHIRLREFEEYGPRTVSAGNLIHLKTEFTIDTIKTGFPTLGTIMLQLLHPTSAVSGMPRQAALDFIYKEEKHSRDLFSGFIGPVNTKDGTHIFVNLRCMRIQEKELILYAGAGVTEDSNPEKEWNETELKCQTLLSVIEV